MKTDGHDTLAKMPLSSLSGVGDKMLERLQRLGLFSVEDLLFHLPLRYEDRTRVVPIASLQAGMQVMVQGECLDSEVVMRRKRMLQCRIAEQGCVLTLKFFYFSAAIQKTLQRGKLVRCFGEVRRGTHGFEMIHPEYQIVSAEDDDCSENNLTPVYPATEGLKQSSLRSFTDQALKLLDRHPLPELIPAEMLSGLPSLHEALKLVHRPPVDTVFSLQSDELDPGRQRLVTEELLAHHLSLLQLRHQNRQHRAIPFSPPSALLEQFLSSLPFSPTGAQSRVVEQIAADLAQNRPMLRLVQGDVGCGKTLVAALAALHVIGNGYQAALMAPTEILAEQHAQGFATWFEPLGIRVGWLGGKLKGKARDTLLQALNDGEIDLLVGTHAIFQEQVQFQSLALVIIDEQHRFGVHQRLALREKGEQGECYPHQLIMTATPIPRTLAMTAYADLDISVIDELPPGRTPVTTVAVPDSRRDEVIERVHRACIAEGRQAYWVCTLIEESEVLECQAAEDTANLLQQALPDLRIGLVHGRMKPAEKQWVMDQFKRGELHLLVATTVIEVGVDVPNASLMIIENPERLGLAQLHQLRGRVGRGAIASHCLLLYHSPLSQNAQARLAVLRESNDGFEIARRDLELRGPGELLGSRQTGMMSFRVADLSRDQALIPDIQQMARYLITHHPKVVVPLVERWVGNRQIYAQA